MRENKLELIFQLLFVNVKGGRSMKYSSWFFMFLIVLMGNPELYEELKEGLENTFNGLKADLEEAKALSEKKREE